MPPPFQALLDAHRVEVHRFLVASVGPDAAEDCFQETFLAALRGYPRLRDESNLRGWLLRIAQRKAIDAHRSRRREAVPVAAPPERPAPEAADPVDGELWALVRQLPAKQRLALAHRYVNDLSHREIAVLLDCSEEAARRSLHEGLSKLRARWRG